MVAASLEAAMKVRSLFLVGALFPLCSLTPSSHALAADLRVLAPLSLRPALSELLSRDEKATGDHISVEYGTAAAYVAKIENNEAFDVIIASPPQIATLSQGGKVKDATNLAKMGVGVIVRAGASRPEIGSVDGFRRAVLEAKSLVHSDPGGGAPAGTYMAGLFKRLGVSEAIKDKPSWCRPGDLSWRPLPEATRRWASTTSRPLLPRKAVDLVGPLPPDIQNTTLFVAAVVTYGQQQQRSEDLIRNLASSESSAVYRAKGLDPM